LKNNKDGRNKSKEKKKGKFVVRGMREGLYLGGKKT